MPRERGPSEGSSAGWGSAVIGVLAAILVSIVERFIRRRSRRATAGDAQAAPSASPDPVPPGAGTARAEHRSLAPGERRTELIVTAAFLIAGPAGLGLFVMYLAGGQTQVEGILLSICLGGLGLGIGLWSRDLMPNTEFVEEREELASPTEPGAPSMTRRTLLTRALAVGLAGLGAAIVLPVLSLGPSPGDSLRRTAWSRGRRLVGENGQLVRSSALAVDSIVTVFPEGSVGVADSQAVLIRVPQGALTAAPETGDAASAGFVVYSKICTHAGCPVGLYRATDHQLICPCHQSTFDVLAGAKPVLGPAVRALPGLPIHLMDDGSFEALGDFTAPVGPSFWDIGRGEAS